MTDQNSAAGSPRADVAAARQRIGETIDDIHDRVAPGVLVEDAADALRKQGVNALQGSRRALGKNPVALGLVGAAVGLWLSARNRAAAPGFAVGSHFREDEGSSAQRGWSEIKKRAGTAGQSLASRADTVRDVTAETWETTRERTRAAADSVRTGADVLSAKSARAIDEKPLAAVLAAAAGGILLGFLLPRTRREDEIMGAASDRLTDAAKSAAQAARDAGSSSFEDSGIRARANTEISALSDDVRAIAKSAAAAASRDIGVGSKSS